MKLNARQVETAKPKDKPYKLADGGGMYLEVFPNAPKAGDADRIAGKEKRVVFGVYPTITLADARSKRDDAKKLLVNGVDPSAFKKESKLAQIEEVKNTFQQIALEWHNMKVKKWSAGYASDILEAFNKDVFPFIGQRPVADIKPLELLNVLKKMEERGATEKAKKVRQRCERFATP